MSILADTVQRNKTSELIYWNKECICKNSNRNFQDNVANLFLPQLMKIKSLLSAFKEDLAQHQTWVQAKLCDGEDEASEELRAALEDGCQDERIRRHRRVIQSMVYNVVLSLHRVEGMKKILPDILSAVISDTPNTEEEEENSLMFTNENIDFIDEE